MNGVWVRCATAALVVLLGGCEEDGGSPQEPMPAGAGASEGGGGPSHEASSGASETPQETSHETPDETVPGDWTSRASLPAAMVGTWQAPSGDRWTFAGDQTLSVRWPHSSPQSAPVASADVQTFDTSVPGLFGAALEVAPGSVGIPGPKAHGLFAPPTGSGTELWVLIVSHHASLPELAHASAISGHLEAIRLVPAATESGPSDAEPAGCSGDAGPKCAGDRIIHVDACGNALGVLQTCGANETCSSAGGAAPACVSICVPDVAGACGANGAMYSVDSCGEQTYVGKCDKSKDDEVCIAHGDDAGCIRLELDCWKAGNYCNASEPALYGAISCSVYSHSALPAKVVGMSVHFFGIATSGVKYVFESSGTKKSSAKFELYPGAWTSIPDDLVARMFCVQNYSPDVSIEFVLQRDWSSASSTVKVRAENRPSVEYYSYEFCYEKQCWL